MLTLLFQSFLFYSVHHNLDGIGEENEPMETEVQVKEYILSINTHSHIDRCLHRSVCMYKYCSYVSKLLLKGLEPPLDPRKPS